MRCYPTDEAAKDSALLSYDHDSLRAPQFLGSRGKNKETASNMSTQAQTNLRSRDPDHTRKLSIIAHR